MQSSIYGDQTKKGPSKPPLPSRFQFPAPSNILDSIPNSAQLASIANAALQSIIDTPTGTTPPPPTPTIANILRHKPPLIPSRKTPSIPETSPAPATPSAITPLSNLNANMNTSNNSNSSPPIIQKKRARKRGKRGAKKNRQKSKSPHSSSIVETKNKRIADGDDEETKTEEVSSLESMSTAKRNLIQAVELERRNHELTKIALIELHKHYGKNIKTQKQHSKTLKKKLEMYRKHANSQNNAALVMQQKQNLQQMYLMKKQQRLKDEEQIKHTNKENQKLTICLHYLKQHIASLQTQYNSLCEQYQVKNTTSTAKNDTELQMVMHDMDSLMSQTETIQMNEYNDGGDAGLMYEDPWFAKIVDENKMLERHIRLLRHIIERETKRCAFREVIIGKALTPPNGSPLKPEKMEKVEKKETESEDEEK